MTAGRFVNMADLRIAAIRFLAQECNEIARNHGFWPPEGRNDGELIALIHSEASELLEACRKNKDAVSPHIPAYLLTEEECADIIIRVLDMAFARNWNVAEAIMAKIDFNRGREFKHGKAF
jgi:NTP pyrophosphatase (non-canonical NTP hydrolase)